MGSPARPLKDALYGQLSRIGKAVAAPRRLELLDLLGQAPRTVDALARLTSSSVANVSQHLQILRAARLVEAEKKGLYVEYRLAGAEVGHFFLVLRTLAESRLAELEQMARQYAEGPDALEPVTTADLLQRVKAGTVTVLDVRPEEEYRAGHIPGALSVPLPELKLRLSQLPKGRDVVAYCRGPYCLMAAEAVAMLRKKGFNAHRLDQGVVEWRARRWRVERSGAAPR